MSVDLKAGIKAFEKDTFLSNQALYESLSGGQNPSVLMITCADSRIVPSEITNTNAGDIFICRNAGNIIPPHGSTIDGTIASIEFAINTLDIKTVVICGHSDCGAMRGVMDKEGTKSLTAVSAWLEFACQEEHHDLCELTQDNIKTQAKNLKTYPGVQEKLDAGELKIEGWYYDIGAGKVHILEL